MEFFGVSGFLQSGLDAKRKGRTISLLSFRPSKDEVDFHPKKSYDSKMELQVPGEDPKPLKEPDRELMALVDGMLGQVSCGRIGSKRFFCFRSCFGVFRVSREKAYRQRSSSDLWHPGETFTVLFTF